VAALALAAAAGCVSFSARAQVGPVADSGGRAGIVGMITAGYGWAGDRHAAGWNAGVETDPHGDLRVASAVDVVRLHGDEWGVRAGAHSVAPWRGGPTSFGGHMALLRPLRARTRVGGGDLAKDFAHLFLGIETRAGVVVDDPGGDPPRFEAGAALTLELLFKYSDAL